ncbi:hypothetical protein B0A48_14333 [Cryoendolithus antarcticus]|uniref:Uncharacterized protein n=1 Tax=Cryoendolithus antarcticus TaxID=1507870 RepID=A0A1V8SJM4_9PEZI|nr:hypothetical protein B0A48_14333 [Cryoendolithus antarcticus]
MSTATVAQEAQAAKPRAASPTKLSRAPSPAKSTTSSEVFPNYDSAYSNSTTYVLLVPVPLLNDHDLPSLTAARSATSSQGDRYSNDCRATDPYANSPEDQEMLDQMEKAMEVASASTEGLSPYDTDLKHLHTAVEAAKLDFKVWEQGEGNKEIQSQVLRRLAQTWFPGDRYGMPETKVEE